MPPKHALQSPSPWQKPVTMLQPNITITQTVVRPLVAGISAAMRYPMAVDVVDNRALTREPLREFEADPIGKVS